MNNFNLLKYCVGSGALRNRLNLSQSKLSRILGVTQNTVALWEQGRRSPVGPARVSLRMLLSTRTAEI
ncbi:MAG: helix-turn-helix domain-containing protein [Armatimonadetes bacterium]|nr:helix-turn-helix domain-containing protein [Armatimonadota bacterium]